jgi:hypothetical protein
MSLRWGSTPRLTDRLPVGRNVTLNLTEHSTCHQLANWFAGLFFDPEDGGAMLLRNVGCYTTNYTASYPRR